MPIHNRDQIEEATLDRDIGNVRTRPDWVGLWASCAANTDISYALDAGQRCAAFDISPRSPSCASSAARGGAPRNVLHAANAAPFGGCRKRA